MPSTVLIDTNVASFLFGGDPEAALYDPIVRGHVTALSFQTVAELLQGALEGGWGPARMDSLRGFISTCPIIHSDDVTVRDWARIVTAFELSGRTISEADAWVGATAKATRLLLVTHDTIFTRVGIRGLRVRTAL